MEFLKMCRFTGSQEANGARQAGGGRPLAREEGHRLGQQGRPQRSHAARRTSAAAAALTCCPTDDSHTFKEEMELPLTYDMAGSAEPT